MNVGFDTIANNVGVSFEITVMLIFLFGGLVWFAKDFKIGIMYYFVGSGAIFMWFYNANYMWHFPAIIMFISLILMAFSLYGMSKASSAGQVI